MSFFARLCRSGLVTYSEIKSGKLTLADCYDLTLMIDFQEACDKKLRLKSAGVI